jgi:hypothetical protein
MFVGSMLESMNHFPSNTIRSSLMWPPSILRVFRQVAFELRQAGFLDGTTACQLKNDYGVVPGESLWKLCFSLFRQAGNTLPARLQT